MALAYSTVVILVIDIVGGGSQVVGVGGGAGKAWNSIGKVSGE